MNYKISNSWLKPVGTKIHFGAPPRIYLSENQIQQVFNEIDDFQVSLETKEYKEDLFKGYRNVIIAGPPRSGTTFTSKAIAQTLKYNYIDEGHVNLRDVKICKNLMSKGNNVVQAPGFTHCIDYLPTDEDLVVFLIRPWSDIVKSIFRVNNFLSSHVSMSYMYEWHKFNYVHPEVRFNCAPSNDSTIGDCYDKHVSKNSYYLDSHYKMWKHYQRNKIKNWIQLDYNSMKNHPNWINKDLRKNFTRRQTTI